MSYQSQTAHLCGVWRRCTGINTTSIPELAVLCHYSCIHSWCIDNNSGHRHSLHSLNQLHMSLDHILQTLPDDTLHTLLLISTLPRLPSGFSLFLWQFRSEISLHVRILEKIRNDPAVVSSRVSTSREENGQKAGLHTTPHILLQASVPHEDLEF